MDRYVTYVGAIPLDRDVNVPQGLAVQGLGWALELTMGSGAAANGLACLPAQSGLGVSIDAGTLVQMLTQAPVSEGSIAVDTTPLLQQGINTTATSLTFSGSGTWTVYASVSIAPGGATVLPYYNAANPAQTWAGPSNNGQPNYTAIQARVALGATQGSVPSGSVVLYTVTVPSGATSVTAAMIAYAAGAPFYPTVPQLALVRTRGQEFTSHGSYSFTVPVGVFTVWIEAARAAGGGSGAGGGNASSEVSSGGGGGGGEWGWLPVSVLPGSVFGIQVGQGGGAGQANGTSGGQGGNTTVTLNGTTVMTLVGGYGGGNASSGSVGSGGNGGSGGSVASGGRLRNGSGGTYGIYISGSQGIAGIGGSSYATLPGPISTGTQNTGQTGTAAGGGASGGLGTANGAAGADGEVILVW